MSILSPFDNSVIQQHHEERWVSLTHGMHDVPVGSHIPLYIQPDHLYIFDVEGKLVAAPHLAEVEEH